MELREEKNKDKNGLREGLDSQGKTGSVSPEDSEVIKVTISKKAEKVVAGLLVRVNENYDGGKVNRQDLLSWIVIKFAEEFTEQDVRTIRGDHLDELTLLEMSLRKFKQSGGLPPELRKLLLTQAGFDDLPKKTSKSRLTNKSSNVGLQDEEVSL